jgi:hypothetical protein
MPRARSILVAATICLVLAGGGFLLIRQTSAPATRAATEPAPPADGLVVYYFNGDFHCETCDNFESYARRALEAGFTEPMRLGRLQWRVVNVDRPANRHYIQEYRVISRTIVLATYRGGKQVRWRSLAKIWDLAGNQRDFERYVHDEVAAELGAIP